MDRNGKEFLICDCEGTMALDAKALAKACGVKDLAVNHQLCRQQLEEFQRQAAKGTPLVVACTQEAPLFVEALGEIEGAADVSFTNIRERAGWSEEGDKAAPKIAARPEPTPAHTQNPRCPSPSLQRTPQTGR